MAFRSDPGYMVDQYEALRKDTGSFGFLLTAVDGQLDGGGDADRFRIKIWDLETGQIIYDNQLGDDDNVAASTVLGGGSVVIHK